MNTSFLHSLGRRLFAVAGTSSLLAASPLLAPAAQSAAIRQALVEQKVSPAEGVAYGYFGTSVALRGTTALIGAPGENTSQGAAYFYVNSGGTWTEGQRITASDAQALAQFGHAVALQGSTAVVTAYTASPGGISEKGAAYVYTLSGGSWVQTQELILAAGGRRNFFGSAVALDGDYLVIGAQGVTPHGFGSAGAAYVFSRQNGVWVFKQELTAGDGNKDHAFGASVAISGGVILVGAPHTSVYRQTYQGAVYVYALSGRHWVQTQKLVGSDGRAFDSFGSAVALNDSAAVIGAEYATVDGNDEAGEAYTFSNNSGTFTEGQELFSSPLDVDGYFGYAVAIADSTVLITEAGADVGHNGYQGAAYIYRDGPAGYALQARIISSDGQGGDEFGQSAALASDALLLGTANPLIDGHAEQGAAYFYSQSPQ